MNDLLSFLFGDSQNEAEAEATREVIERIMEEAEVQEPLKTKRTPLTTALKSLGLKDLDQLDYDPEGFSLTCSDETCYRKAVALLMEPDAMEKLAKLGWVVSRCGDVAMANEAPEMRIRFLEITTADSDDKDSWPAPNDKLMTSIIKKGREFATTPLDADEANPVEHPEATNKQRAGVGDAKDGADPEGTPKTGKSKSESLDLARTMLEGGHKPGCTCGFCKNKGRFGKKKDDDSATAEKPKPEPETKKADGDVEHTFEGIWQGTQRPETSEVEPARFDDVQEALAARRGRPKTPAKTTPVARSPKAAKVHKAYRTPKKA